MITGSESLVGRSEELAFLDRTLTGLGRERTAAVGFVGEPGIGKTRMLAELGARAAERGQLVLSGRASEFERELPFWVFVDAVDEYLRGLERPRLERLGRELGGELGHLLPSLAGFASEAEGALQHERYRAHRAMCELFERLAAAAPVVCLLDDLHWADPASVELIGALLRRPPRAPVLLAFALRSRQAPRRLSTALQDARRAGLLEPVELRVLSEKEAATLLGEGVEPALVRSLFEQSGGNPYYLEQLARVVERPGRASEQQLDAASWEVPAAVAAALAEELAQLSSHARGLLEAAAIAGDPFQLELAAAAAPLATPDALGALDELTRVDLVRTTGVPGRFRFRHPLVRTAVYEGTAEGWRLAAHERADHALSAVGADATARAHHVEQSAPLGDRTAVALLRDAGDAAARRAPDNAVRWYQAALRLLSDQPADLDERIELLEPLAGALAATGRVGESHARMLELLELLPAGREGARVRLIAACARLEYRLGRRAQARARLAGTLAQLSDRASQEAVALMLELAHDAFLERDYDAIAAWGARALAVARSLGDHPLTAAATTSLALGAALSGSIAQAESHSTDAAALIDSLPDAQLALRLDAIANLAAAELAVDRYRDALGHADRGIAVGRATGQGQLFPILSQTRAGPLWMLGRLEEAAEVLDGAIEAARLSGDLQSLCWSLASRAGVALDAGDLELGLSAVSESVELAGRLIGGIPSRLEETVLGWAQLETGQPARCVEVIPASAGGPDLPVLTAQWRTFFQEVMTRAWLALDRADEAARAARRAEDIAGELGLGRAVTAARRARAAVALADGDPATAAELALASAAAAELIEARLEAARSRALAGRAFAAAGDNARAAAELERATAELDACGAARYRDEAARELRRLGRRFQPHRRGDAAGALTAREHEIAELVRLGRTNREIAAELFLSEKTVETHLRNAFRKFGVSSRTSLAREL